jgi:hypothetical protein
MSRRSGFILAMALLLAVGLIASYVLGKLEPYEDVIEHGPSPEVASSPYLAAEHFLRKQGIAARRAEGLDVLDELPSEGQTLMLLADRGNMTPPGRTRTAMDGQWRSSAVHRRTPVGRRGR